MEPRRLLVVDDSLTIRRALEFILKPQGYALKFASDGREALDHAGSFEPDLILLDYVLPDMRGPDVCAALGAIPETAHTPVILVSAKGASIRQAYRDAQNVVSYITKPFKAQVVLSVVENALAHLRAGASRGPAALPEGDPIGDAASTTFPMLRPATLEETFSTLLAQLEEAVASRAASTNSSMISVLDRSLASLGEPLRRAREQLQQISLHLEGGAVAPYRLDRNGSFSNIATTLLETHRLLCDAALAMASIGAPGPSLPAPPRLLAVCPAEHSSHRELEELVDSRSEHGAMLLDREFTSLPWLVGLLRPHTLLAVPGVDEELDGALRLALAELPPGIRSIAFVAPELTLSEEWGRFAVRAQAHEELEAALADLGAGPERTASSGSAFKLEVVTL